MNCKDLAKGPYQREAGGVVIDRSDEELILVDQDDNVIGYETKLRVHQNGGNLHRAFSIFVVDSLGRILLQRRAKRKYHFACLWSNTCCGHPRRGETLQDAVHRRLREEFGFDTELQEILSFVYRAADASSGLTEHEYDHVFLGRFDGEPCPNPDEVEEFKWVDITALTVDLECNPHRYTPWFSMVVPQVIKSLPYPLAAAPVFASTSENERVR